MRPKPTPMAPEVLAGLEAGMAHLPCPRCEATGTLTIREAYDPTRPEPAGVPASRLGYGPKGQPLWAWCGACGAHGRVANVTGLTGLTT